MDNVLFVTLVFWPVVVLFCAGINMAVSWTFSWSELVFDVLIGVVAGYFLFAGSDAEAHAAEVFFMIFSHGLFAWLYAASDGFRAAVGGVSAFFWLMAGIRVGATLWAAAWDHLSARLGAKLEWGPFFFSFVLAPVKLPFALVTSAVGFLIWLAGAAWATFGKGKAGFAGGVFFTEFVPSYARGHHATTVGSTVHCWIGGMPFKHELYHTRQYIYMSDWLIPFWCIGCIWGIVSAAASSAHSVSAQLAFGADASGGAEIGNPVEIAAYRLA